jgi:hypothetical protein
VAVLSGLFFNLGIVKPLMRGLLNFATRPSEGLEGQVAHPAEAMSAFDAQGRGIVRLTLDGEIIQLLARLDPAEIERGVRVRRGDEVLVTEVDASKNACKVTRELSQ